MRIDVHNHAIPAPVIEVLRRDGRFGMTVAGGALRSDGYPDHDLYPSLVDPEAKLAELRQRGLDGAVVSLSPRLLCYHTEPALGEIVCEATNRGLKEFCGHDATRLHWMAHVPLQDPARAVRMLAAAVDEGAVGVAVGSSVASRPLDEPALEPFWEAAEQAGLPVFVHSAYNARIPGLDAYHLTNVIGNLLSTTICAERLICAGTLDRHPRLRVVLAHAGGYFPYQAGRLGHASTVRGEFAGTPRDPWSYVGRLLFDAITHDTQALAYLIARAGIENVVLGTDLPYDMALPDPVGTLRAAAGEPGLRAIAEEAPARIFGL